MAVCGTENALPMARRSLPRPARGWTVDPCDVCALPGGSGRCVYVTFCPCFAAGEVASRVTGAYYALDCCPPVLLAAACIPIPIHCLLWSWTRHKLVRQYGIDEPHETCAGSCLKMILCSQCLLCQELNELDIRDYARSSAPSQQSMNRGVSMHIQPTVYVTSSSFGQPGPTGTTVYPAGKQLFTGPQPVIVPSGAMPFPVAGYVGGDGGLGASAGGGAGSAASPAPAPHGQQFYALVPAQYVMGPHYGGPGSPGQHALWSWPLADGPSTGVTVVPPLPPPRVTVRPPTLPGALPPATTASRASSSPSGPTNGWVDPILWNGTDNVAGVEAAIAQLGTVPSGSTAGPSITAASPAASSGGSDGSSPGSRRSGGSAGGRGGGGGDHATVAPSPGAVAAAAAAAAAAGGESSYPYPTPYVEDQGRGGGSGGRPVPEDSYGEPRVV